MRLKKHTKYYSKRVTVDGIKFASKLEAKRYGQLKLLERAEDITDLDIHPTFNLIAGIRYVADFSYTILERTKHGVCERKIVEDTKGVKTPGFRLKEKLFRHCFPHIELRILSKQDV